MNGVNDTLTESPPRDGAQCYGDRDGALYNEVQCNNTDGCIWRMFQGSGGPSSGEAPGYCDQLFCEDFADNAAACNGFDGCVFDSGMATCVAESLASGSGIGSGSGSNNGGDNDEAVAEGCFDFYSEAECSSNGECEWVTPSGSGAQVSFCLERGCITQQTENDCNAFDNNCIWDANSNFCTDSFDGSGQGARCFSIQDSSACTAASCLWSAMAGGSGSGGQDGFCSEFQCELMMNQTMCNMNSASGCLWSAFDGSGAGSGNQGVGGCTTMESTDDPGNEPDVPCFHESQEDCNADAACSWLVDDAGFGFCQQIECRTLLSQNACTSWSADCVWHVSLYHGAQCYNTSGQEIPNDDANLDAYSIQCERITSEESCTTLNFCDWVDGGPGCIELGPDCSPNSRIACGMFTEILACENYQGCVYDYTYESCEQVTTPAPPPPLPPVTALCDGGDQFTAGLSFWPPLWLGRLGQFTCSEVYSVGPQYETNANLLSVLRSECCVTPSTMVSTTIPPPTTASPTAADYVPTSRPTTGNPTAQPIVDGGHTLELTFPTANDATLSGFQRASFAFAVEYEVARRMNINQRDIIRVDLSPNDQGQVVATVVFAAVVSDLDAFAASTNFQRTPVRIFVTGVQYRSSQTVADINSRRPTPSPVTAAPSFPSGTLAPSPPPTAGGGDTAAAGSSDDEGVDDNVMIIVVVVVVLLVALVAFVVWVRTQRSADKNTAPIRPTHNNPVYQAQAPSNGPGPGTGPGKTGGMVRVESMC